MNGVCQFHAQCIIIQHKSLIFLHGARYTFKSKISEFSRQKSSQETAHETFFKYQCSVACSFTYEYFQELVILPKEMVWKILTFYSFHECSSNAMFIILSRNLSHQISLGFVQMTGPCVHDLGDQLSRYKSTHPTFVSFRTQGPGIWTTQEIFGVKGCVIK